ncbi:TetR/AcrR family transcriptional regulator [Amycolatopsis rhizosphaerae]|uniref:TetR/AcrR family transcriptional regulator n=1 Tax=Amycolatopsis rhizosphaerae TaxID=2053003 RepID=A0A558CW65_9PSEU|nr:TetR/AcrR family transcriptional regulator [Amycolatopsis rhizosphaerae]TVT53000.1 TetR/AcrR family transcriptional regulator [Amycolatopsis rhizosphaerae]
MTDAPGRPEWASARALRADKGHETRSLLLDAAARVFTRLGYARTTIADITAEAEVSRPTFYAYFETKADVFREVAARVRDEFLAGHEIPDVDVNDPYALGRASAEAFLAAHAANHELLTVIEHQAITDERIREIWQEITRRPTRRVARYVERLAKAGKADPAATPAVVAEAITGIFARFARQVPADREGFERLVDELTAIYLRILGVDRASG